MAENNSALKRVYQTIFTSGRTLSKLRDEALADRLLPASVDELSVPGRSIAWKLFFLEVYGGPLPSGVSAKHMQDSLQSSRSQYVQALVKHMKAPDGSFEADLQIPGAPHLPRTSDRAITNLDRNNPLSLHNDNPWTEWFASVELRKTIRQDVERTFPEMVYFRDPEVQAQLTVILFLYASANPSIGYRQGMHELLAPLYYAVAFDSMVSSERDDLPADCKALGAICDADWVAADAWTLFDALMKSASQWYEWRESPPTSRGLGSPLSHHVNIHVGNKPPPQEYVAPIVKACNRIQSDMLKNVDPALYSHMQASGIEPQIYGIRWLRLLFTREFSLQDSMLIWDGLFAVDPSLELAQWICVAMLVRIRNQLLQSDYGGQLTFLLRYPALPTEPRGGPNDMPYHTSLLLRQALAFQMSPSPTTGVSIVLENRNLLGIPVEPLEASPHVERRRPGHIPRDKAASTSDLSRPGFPRSPPSQAFGFPEGITRGLLERGESLGINKSFMNAVSEIRRNIPDIAASLVRSPNASSTSSYPLIDERPPEERPPWEPRTRFEMEREMAQLRLNNRKLADSVSWIVDTLLQDESEDGGSERVKKIQSNKRDALESLAYVRDVLRGAVADIDEDRLYSEEEFQKRMASLSTSHRHNKSSSQGGQTDNEDTRFQLAKPTAPTPVPVADSWSKITSPSEPRSSRSPPRSANQGITRFSSHPGTVSMVPSPPANKPVLAPWNYTRSGFSNSSSLPAAALPRPPPPTSTVLLPPPPAVERLSGDQTPRHRVNGDPLGVLQ